MLPAYSGRVDRKTFLIGICFGLGGLAIVALIYIVPIAVIDIIINKPGVTSVLSFLYKLYALPVLFFYFFFSILFVRRIHDLGYPGMLALFGFTGAIVLGKLLDFAVLNLLALLLLAVITLKKGQASRNNFGPKPPKRFKSENLKVTIH